MRAKDLLVGAVFTYGGDEWMALDQRSFEFLKDRRLVTPLGDRDLNVFPVEVVRLEVRRESGLMADTEVVPAEVRYLRFSLIAAELQKALQEAGLLGVVPGNASIRHQSAKPNLAQQAKMASFDTAEDAFFKDRLKAARALPDCVPIKETKQEVNTVTAGDNRVNQARKRTIQSIDANLAALQNCSELCAKFGVNAELEEALKAGLKGMDPYLKLRKRPDMLRRTERQGKVSKCARCGKDTSVTIMSYFNTDIICMECDEKERKHPEFKAAQAEEERHVRAGNWNFKGVGRPKDL